MYYKLVKIIINTTNLAKVILDIIVQYHNFLDLIMIDKSFFWFFNFGYYLVSFLILNTNFLTYFIFKSMAKLKDKITL